MSKETSKVVEAAHDMLKNDKCIFQILDTVGAAAVSLSGANISPVDALALLTVGAATLTLVGIRALSGADEDLTPVEFQALNFIITEAVKKIKE